jgi:hypothetical protein
VLTLLATTSEMASGTPSAMASGMTLETQLATASAMVTAIQSAMVSETGSVTASGMAWAIPPETVLAVPKLNSWEIELEAAFALLWETEAQGHSGMTLVETTLVSLADAAWTLLLVTLEFLLWGQRASGMSLETPSATVSATGSGRVSG